MMSYNNNNNNKTAGKCSFKSDKLMDAIFQEGLVRKRLKRFLKLTPKVWPATPSCISLIRKIVRNRLGT